jgi:hypothetical protein
VRNLLNPRVRVTGSCCIDDGRRMKFGLRCCGERPERTITLIAGNDHQSVLNSLSPIYSSPSRGGSSICLKSLSPIYSSSSRGGSSIRTKHFASHLFIL